MIGKALILDLDDTIFQTKSMDKEVFAPFFNHFISNLKPNYDELIINSIINDLWQRPWDVVLNKYDIPKATLLNSINVLENLKLNLNISTYPDYAFIKNIQCTKFLVTTSLTSLQQSKIKALNIEHDFTKIIINDTLKNSKTKLDIFKDLILEYNLIPEKTYVIGDNSDSEIKAGNLLNMITVQILRENVIKGDNANHYIKSFNELATILN